MLGIKFSSDAICATVNGTSIKHPPWATSVALSCSNGYGCLAINARSCSQYGGVFSNGAIRAIALFVVLTRARRIGYKCSNGTIFAARSSGLIRVLASSATCAGDRSWDNQINNTKKKTKCLLKKKKHTKNSEKNSYHSKLTKNLLGNHCNC